MKLYTLGCIIAIASIGLTSCQKTYKCSCYSPSLNRSIPDSEIKGTRKDAKENCAARPTTGQFSGSDYICNLK